MASMIFQSWVFGFAVLLLGSAGQARQDVKTLMPVDEAAMRPDFLNFRMRLQNIVAKHDTAALLDIVHPDIKSSFGGDEGIENFKEFWRIKEPDSRLWTELAAVLALGGSFDGTEEFTAPYTFSRWPQGVDSFEHVAVIGANVRIRSEARADAAVITSVSYSILELHEEALQKDWAHEEWTAIKLNGQKAYVASRLIRSPIDYRARFVYSSGRWQMTLFIAGD